MNYSLTLLTPREVADLLCIKEHTLAVWRNTKRYNIPHVKVGSKVRYRIADVEAFIASRIIN